MNLPRRQFLLLAAGAAALPAVSRIALAQTFPSRPVHIVVGYAAGSAGDIVARLIGQWLSDRFGQPFVIDNRPGASGNIGTEVVVRAPPDGYTLLWCNSANTINSSLYDNLSFNFGRDITPVASISRTPLIMEITPSFPAKTIPEFIAYAKGNPGKISMASIGNGTVQHVAGELFKMMTGIEMVHVPYHGSPQALTDLIAGQVQVMFDTLPSSIAQIKAGKLHALGVTTAARLETLPDIPTVGEFVSGYEASGWIGVGAPKDAPVEIIDQLNKDFNAALADPKISDRIADLGGLPFSGSPADFGRFIAAETEKGRKVIQAADIRPE
jgi:tripartite-type tricarboxylate transporter receptor subunit TctC